MENMNATDTQIHLTDISTLVRNITTAWSMTAKKCHFIRSLFFAIECLTKIAIAWIFQRYLNVYIIFFKFYVNVYQKVSHFFLYTV